MPSSQGGVPLLPFTRTLSTTSILACGFPPSAGELANCSLPTHSSNDWRVSQMRPAVEGQGGRDLQVWAFSAIPKGNLNSPHSVQLGRHSHSCLGEAASASRSPRWHRPGPPLPSPAQPQEPERRQPACKYHFPECRCFYTHMHSRTQAHTLRLVPLFSV